MFRLKRAASAAAIVLVAACSGDAGKVTGPAGPQRTISDAAHAGAVPGFYFLPSMVPQPSYSGTFDPAVSPTVQICELVGTSCGPVIATYTTTTGPGGELVTVGADHYKVNWKTAQFNLDPAKHYRISVYSGALELGFADVDVVSSGSQLKHVDSGEYIPLLDDRTLAIKFRIETGIVGEVIVTPADTTIFAGETVQYTASYLDLHGNPVAGPPAAWSSSNPAVATIDANGLATGVGAGTTTITASIGYNSGSTSLTVQQPNTPPVADADTFDAVGNATIPVPAPGVLAGDTDAETPGSITAVAGTYPTTNGGTVVLAADGSFTYLSAAGFTGEDSFTYTATDGIETSAPATVTINVLYSVWYVDNSATAPGDGRDASPFTALASAESASAAGEQIFVLYGNGTPSGYDAGITLKANQPLTGQGVPADVTVTLNGHLVTLLEGGSAPTLTKATGATIQLATNNTVQGVNVLSAAGTGIAGSGFGTFTAAAVNVTATGGPALDLQNGTVAASFATLSSANSPSAGVRLNGVTGTLSAAGGVISGAAGAGVDIVSTSGTAQVSLASLNVQSSAADGVTALAQSTASLSLSMTGGSFAANRGDHLQATASGGATLNVAFTGNTLAGGHPSPLGQGILINTSGAGFAGSVTYDVSNNTINGAVTTAVIASLGASAAAATFSGHVNNNQIGTSGVALSCSAQGSGISIETAGAGTHTASVTGNGIRQCLDRGINAQANSGAGTLNLTVTGNTVAQLVNPSSREGFFLNAGSTTTDAHFVCLALGGAGSAANTLTNGPSGLSAARLRQRFATTVRLPGYAGANTDVAAVSAFVSANNGGASATATVTVPPGGGFVGGAACPTP